VNRGEAGRLVAFYVLALALGSALYVALFHTPLLASIDVFFYRGLGLLLMTGAVTLIGLLLLRRSRYGAGLTVRDALLATSLLVAGNSVVFTHLPVTADRSISVFMLAYMDSTDGSLSSADIEDVVVTEYVRERGAIDKRLDEQIVSGNIEKVGDRYRITDQGRGLMRLYRAIAALYGVDPTNLSP